MNTIVFHESVVGRESAGAYVKADEARARITELEKQLADMTALYHTNNRCECGDDEVCQYVCRIQELELQLSRYQGGVEVEGEVDLIPMGMMRAMRPIIKLPLGSFAKGQAVRVLVIPEERIVDTNKTMNEVE